MQEKKKILKILLWAQSSYYLNDLMSIPIPAVTNNTPKTVASIEAIPGSANVSLKKSIDPVAIDVGISNPIYFLFFLRPLLLYCEKPNKEVKASKQAINNNVPASVNCAVAFVATSEAILTGIENIAPPDPPISP